MTGDPDEFDWLARCDWRLHSLEFGALRASGPIMEFAPASSGITVDDELWRLWTRLPHHRGILGAAEPHWLRYAAIDWSRLDGLDEDHDGIPCIATWGVELTWTFDFLLRTVQWNQLGWFTRAILAIDLEGESRIAFVSDPRISEVAPEVLAYWPRCHEPGLVFAVGMLLHGLLPSSNPLAAIIKRSLDPDVSKRYTRLEDLRNDLKRNGARQVLLPGIRPKRTCWDLLEQGIGFLEVGRAERALTCFKKAADVRSRLQQDALALVFEAATRINPPRDWAEAAPAALARERVRDFAGALTIYNSIPRETADALALDLAYARCDLGVGNIDRAIGLAQTVLIRAPDSREAHAILTNALIEAKRYTDALDAAETWLALAPNDARACYARGKCLLRLVRFVEARDAFEHACTLDPKLLEAMLLRREVDRALGHVRASVGVPTAVTLDLPEHLAELRTFLIEGRIHDAIEALRRGDRSNDAAAQLVLGELLSFDGRFAEAIVAFDRAARDTERVHVARMGKARALLELTRASEALALFDHVCAACPNMPDALAGRAAALRQLDRIDEADLALDQYLATVGNA